MFYTHAYNMGKYIRGHIYHAWHHLEPAVRVQQHDSVAQLVRVLAGIARPDKVRFLPEGFL
jgi:hypothetical protein